jgi:putative membrane protein
MLGAQVPLHWNLDPSVLGGIALLTVAYLLAVTVGRSRFPGAVPVPPIRMLAFVLAQVTILLALVSPIDDLSDNYLFSVHMAEHLLLTLVMPPLLLAGLPGWLFAPLLRQLPQLLGVGRFLTNPFIAFGLFNAIFTLYHAPPLYDASLASTPVHIIAHLLFMTTAVLTWWPVLSPLPALPPLPPPLQMLYLFVQTLPAQFLGAFLTFGETILYQRYTVAPRVWTAMTPLNDQQLGGLLMWVVGGTYFFFAFAFVFIRWVMTAEARERRYRTVGRVR